MANKPESKQVPEQVKRDLDSWEKEHMRRPDPEALDLSPASRERVRQERAEHTRTLHVQLDRKYGHLFKPQAPQPPSPSVVIVHQAPPPTSAVPTTPTHQSPIAHAVAETRPQKSRNYKGQKKAVRRYLDEHPAARDREICAYLDNEGWTCGKEKEAYVDVYDGGDPGKHRIHVMIDKVRKNR